MKEIYQTYIVTVTFTHFIRRAEKSILLHNVCKSYNSFNTFKNIVSLYIFSAHAKLISGTALICGRSVNF